MKTIRTLIESGAGVREILTERESGKSGYLSKMSMLRAKKLLVPILNGWVKRGLIEDYNIKITESGGGWELSVNGEYEHDTWVELINKDSKYEKHGNTVYRISMFPIYITAQYYIEGYMMGGEYYERGDRSGGEIRGPLLPNGRGTEYVEVKNIITHKDLLAAFGKYDDKLAKQIKQLKKI